MRWARAAKIYDNYWGIHDLLAQLPRGAEVRTARIAAPDRKSGPGAGFVAKAVIPGGTRRRTRAEDNDGNRPCMGLLFGPNRVLVPGLHDQYMPHCGLV